MSIEWDWPRVVLLWAMMGGHDDRDDAPDRSAADPALRVGDATERRRAERPRVASTPSPRDTCSCGRCSASRRPALQRVLARSLVLTPMMEPATPIAGAAILAIAGVYQLTPLKRACLRACRSPLGFMMQRWRGGVAAAFRLGVEHGTHCLGCCWALMLILFAGGVMNLVVILALTAWVLDREARAVRRTDGDCQRCPAARGRDLDGSLRSRVYALAQLNGAYWPLLRPLSSFQTRPSTLTLLCSACASDTRLFAGMTRCCRARAVPSPSGRCPSPGPPTC